MNSSTAIAARVSRFAPNANERALAAISRIRKIIGNYEFVLQAHFDGSSSAKGQVTLIVSEGATADQIRTYEALCRQENIACANERALAAISRIRKIIGNYEFVLQAHFDGSSSAKGQVTLIVSEGATADQIRTYEALCRQENIACAVVESANTECHQQGDAWEKPIQRLCSLVSGTRPSLGITLLSAWAIASRGECETNLQIGVNLNQHTDEVRVGYVLGLRKALDRDFSFLIRGQAIAVDEHSTAQSILAQLRPAPASLRLAVLGGAAQLAKELASRLSHMSYECGARAVVDRSAYALPDGMQMDGQGSLTITMPQGSFTFNPNLATFTVRGFWLNAAREAVTFTPDASLEDGADEDESDQSEEGDEETHS